ALQLVPRRVGARCAPHHGRARSDAGGRIGHAKDLRLHPASLPGRGRLRHVPAAARAVRARRVAHALGILPRPSGDADHGRAGHAARDPDHRMAYFARATITPVKGLDLGGAFAGYSDSAEVDGQAMYRTTRGVVRAEYIRDRNRRTDVRTVGWYAFAGYIVTPRRIELLGRVEQYDPSDRVATARSTGHLVRRQDL